MYIYIYIFFKPEFLLLLKMQKAEIRLQKKPDKLQNPDF